MRMYNFQSDAYFIKKIFLWGMRGMKQFITASLELHLYFCRIMKEHALFLLAGFPAGKTEYRKKADWFREEFEKVLERIVELSNGIVGEELLDAREVVTDFTENAERQTRYLTEIHQYTDYPGSEKPEIRLSDCSKPGNVG